MTVKELKDLNNGYYIEVENGKGLISVNFKFGQFEARLKKGEESSFISLSETYEEAIKDIKDF